MKKSLQLIFALFILPFLLLAQETEFENFVLDAPIKNKKLLLSSFTIQEIPKYYKRNQPRQVILENGYAKYKIKNPKDWKSVRKDRIPVAIDIIYTKYPREKKDWRTEYHGLLANRLKELFRIDPSLNNVNITWNIILQTDCYTERQTKKLFHGIAIRYMSKNEVIREELLIGDTLEKAVVIDKKLEENEPNFPTKKIEAPEKEVNENDNVDRVNLLDKLKSDLPNDILKQLEGKSADEEALIVLKYLEKNELKTDRAEITPAFLKTKTKEVEKFIETYSSEEHPEIVRMLDRQKDWENTLVVMDWTGSMYGFGGEVMKWHLLNFEKSGIQKFVLFNDGDGKMAYKKEIGKTGGIYIQSATNIDQLIRMFEVVMHKGRGGDRPENDVEAILKGLEKFPSAKQVVLIADNRSCVRDISLVSKIKIPVKVILCGYTDAQGSNPHYIEIASQTGGSVHTAEQDIGDLKIDLIADKDNLKLTRNNKTMLTIRANCKLDKWYTDVYTSDWIKKNMESESPQMQKIYYSMREALTEPDSVFRLEIATKNLDVVPKEVKNLKNLRHANFSFNQLTKIDKEVLSRSDLQSLDLKHNKITRINRKLYDIETLIRLDISHNELTKLPKGVDDLRLLQELYLNNNQLKKLHKDLASLKRLKILDLSENQITTLPVGSTGWRRIEKLDLSNNKLSELPYIMKSLRRLKYLDASYNRIKVSPIALVGMRSLNYLDLSHNNIMIIPSGIGNLKKLTKLNLSHNKIRVLHNRFGNAANLIELNLSNNQIKSLPPKMSKLKKLKFLNLENNPISAKEQERIKKMLPKTVIKF